jgi:hypothetical protein
MQTRQDVREVMASTPWRASLTSVLEMDNIEIIDPAGHFIRCRQCKKTLQCSRVYKLRPWLDHIAVKGHRTRVVQNSNSGTMYDHLVRVEQATDKEEVQTRFHTTSPLLLDVGERPKCPGICWGEPYQHLLRVFVTHGNYGDLDIDVVYANGRWAMRAQTCTGRMASCAYTN